ncbi:hypothetical protein ATI14_4167 [Pseudomonas tolaasii NCPPB 2192]|uniref:Uncharacterized protein n=1 Tax=Pseudomonas tolaasii NCPPB 2192 TaxID=564423 RepID=A0ABX4QKF2_PSETO|nr:hypothetical protein ATI14_4167 [Pseudomonas tolaasii NCPPB 2192]
MAKDNAQIQRDKRAKEKTLLHRVNGGRRLPMALRPINLCNQFKTSQKVSFKIQAVLTVIHGNVIGIIRTHFLAINNEACRSISRSYAKGELARLNFVLPAWNMTRRISASSNKVGDIRDCFSDLNVVHEAYSFPIRLGLLQQVIQMDQQKRYCRLKQNSSTGVGVKNPAIEQVSTARDRGLYVRSPHPCCEIFCVFSHVRSLIRLHAGHP